MADESEEYATPETVAPVEPPPPPAPESTYVIRPNYANKFKKGKVKHIISKVIAQHLANKSYDPDEVGNWTNNICNTIKEKVKKLEFQRYKIAVQCVIGEQRGNGAKMACRCFWDSDTDNYAQQFYTNNSIFCVVAVFGVYFY